MTLTQHLGQYLCTSTRTWSGPGETANRTCHQHRHVKEAVAHSCPHDRQHEAALCAFRQQTPRVRPPRAHQHPLRKPPYPHSQGHPGRTLKACGSSCLQGSTGRGRTWSQNPPTPANTKKITIFKGKSKHKDKNKTKLNCEDKKMYNFSSHNRINPFITM